MTYRAPHKDMMFALEHIAGMSQIISDTGMDLDLDTVAGILDEAAKFNQDVVAPTNSVGDHQPSALVDGQVVTSPGFKAAFEQYVQAGWQGLSHPEAVGGQNLPKMVATACNEMINAANTSFGLCPMLTDGAIEAVLTAGSQAQQQKYIPKLISGEWTGSMNLTEPGSGSDLALIRTRAEPQADGRYKIFGTKIFITYGDHDFTDNIMHLVLARTPNAPEGIKGISLFIVPKRLIEADGSLGAANDVQTLSLEHKLGIKASPTAVLQFGDQGGAWGELVGSLHHGLEYMFIMMNAARFGVGVQAIGLMDRAYQKALKYAQERVQSRPVDGSVREAVAIVHHPDVKRMLLTMTSTTQACRAMALHTAGLLDLAHQHPEAAVRERSQAQYEFMVPLVKGYSTEMSVDIASLGVQIHGGMGFIEETGVAQYYRDARILPIYEGTTAIQANDLIGRKTLRDGGAVALSFADEIDACVAQLNTCTPLVGLVEPLTQANRAFRDVVAFVLAQAKVQPNEVFAGSVLYLKLAGLLISGWHMARAAIVAQKSIESGHSDIEFMHAKITSAQFYIRAMLPQTQAWARAIVDAGEVVGGCKVELL